MKEEDLEELALESGQWQIVHHVCRIMARELELDEAPVRGFFWKSLRDWQLDRGLPTTAMNEMEPAARIRAAQEIGVFFRQRLLSSLGPTVGDRVDVAWAEAFRTYVRDYGRRGAGVSAEASS